MSDSSTEELDGVYWISNIAWILIGTRQRLYLWLLNYVEMVVFHPLLGSVCGFESMTFPLVLRVSMIHLVRMLATSI